MTADLRDIVREHGGELYAGGRRATIPGPNHSRKDRSLSLRVVEDENGSRVIWHSFAQNTADEVRRYLGIPVREGREATQEERGRWKQQREAEERRQRAEDQALCASIWAGSRPIEGTLAESYLWSRGLLLEDCPDIRFHPAAPRAKPRRPDDTRPLPQPHPAMVAVVRDRDGASMSLHLTYLALDGKGKAFGRKSRLMFGPMRGGTVHLSRPGPTLALGEGIETCLGYRARTGLPVWAALTTSQYATFQAPRGVRRLIIAADGDKGGLSAATALGERLQRTCDIEIDPAPDGKDWADVHLAESAGV
jgi:putative DNA primase/helicase